MGIGDVGLVGRRQLTRGVVELVFLGKSFSSFKEIFFVEKMFFRIF